MTSSRKEERARGIRLERPGTVSLLLTHLLLDFNGTLALDGELLPGVAERILGISALLSVTVLTSDTFGTAAERLAGLPVEVRIVRSGWDKKEFVASLSGGGIVAIGNGRNDIDMLRNADLGIAVMGGEGLAMELVQVAALVVARVEDALDVLLSPRRLTATLRS